MTEIPEQWADAIRAAAAQPVSDSARREIFRLSRRWAVEDADKAA